MITIFIFFGEDISNVDSTFNMVHSDGFILNAFSDSIFFDLDVSKAFGGRVERPMNTSLVVIVYWHSISRKMEIFE